MAGYFNATQKTLSEGGMVYCPRFVTFEAVSGTLRAWEGFGPKAMGGNGYAGAGQLGAISDISADQNDDAGKVSFTLSGVSPAVAAAVRAGKEMRGRTVTIQAQFFDVATQQPLDSPFLVDTLLGDVMSYSAQGPDKRTISLSAESIWSGRNRASYATYSPGDQEERFSGDLGAEFVPSLKNKVISWPFPKPT